MEVPRWLKKARGPFIHERSLGRDSKSLLSAEMVTGGVSAALCIILAAGDAFKWHLQQLVLSRNRISFKK